MKTWAKEFMRAWRTWGRGTVTCEEILHGCHGGVGDATVVYEGEMVEVGGEVEGEAMHGYPAFHVDADGGDLVPVDPDAGFSVSPCTSDAKACKGRNQGFFQFPEVIPQVCAVSGEVHDGVADDLARAVVGDVSATVGVDELDAPGRELRF